MSAKKKDKLHALLAVEGDVKSQAESVTKEAEKLFKDKADHFFSKYGSYEPLEDGGLRLPDEAKEMITTVDEKLNYVQKALVRAMDCSYQKENTNTVAKADLIVDDQVIEKDVPATVLLNLEGRLKAVRSLYQAIPTLPPGKLWKEDDQEKAGIYLSPTECQFKMEKRVDSRILHPATKEHPAQIQAFNKDVAVGKWSRFQKTGVWSSNKKSQTLLRIDTLIRAVKTARQRANDVEIIKTQIGKKLFDYINN